MYVHTYSTSLPYTSNMMGLVTRAIPRPATAPPCAATVVATHIENMNPIKLSVEQTRCEQRERGREKKREREGGCAINTMKQWTVDIKCVSVY